MPGVRVLVVDDNRDSADSMGLLLSLLGYPVVIAYDASSALERARQFLPEVALIDLAMPHMNGCELAKKLRRVPELQKVRLLALTGCTTATARTLSRDAGFTHYLLKPVDIGHLLKIIKN
jgi:CheY-like chemotaxis protein